MADDDDVVWRLTIGDEVHEFTRGSWMLSEAREVKKWIGLNPPAMWLAVGQDDPDAWTALLCILRRRNGQPDLRFSDVDADYGAMQLVPVEEDTEADDEPDPTPAESST